MGIYLKTKELWDRTEFPQNLFYFVPLANEPDSSKKLVDTLL